MSFTTEPNWKWDNSTEVRSKKCKGCGKSMYLDVASAILYQNENWHVHCLLDMLTEHHSGKKVVKPEDLELSWGNAP